MPRRAFFCFPRWYARGRRCVRAQFSGGVLSEEFLGEQAVRGNRRRSDKVPRAVIKPQTDQNGAVDARHGGRRQLADARKQPFFIDGADLFQ